jgi:hypothetical protein
MVSAALTAMSMGRSAQRASPKIFDAIAAAHGERREDHMLHTMNEWLMLGEESILRMGDLTRAVLFY